MNYSNIRQTLDMHDIASQFLVGVKRNNAKRRFHITLTEHGMPYIISADCYAVFYAYKPDGTKIYNDAVIKDNSVVFELTSQATAVTGRCECELVLYDRDGDQITSPRFTIVVYEKLIDEDAIESTDEYTALALLVTEAHRIIDMYENGELQGAAGNPGNGILSIEKTSTEGLVNTYTIIFTNGSTTHFTVTNGEAGKDGHSPKIAIQNGNWWIDGVDTGKTAEGVKGDPGTKIESITIEEVQNNGWQELQTFI